MSGSGGWLGVKQPGQQELCLAVSTEATQGLAPLNTVPPLAQPLPGVESDIHPLLTVKYYGCLQFRENFELILGLFPFLIHSIFYIYYNLLQSHSLPPITYR